MQSRNHLWRNWSLLAAEVSFNWIIPLTQTLKRMLYNIIWNVNVISYITLIINSFVGWIYHRGYIYFGYVLLIILILHVICALVIILRSTAFRIILDNRSTSNHSTKCAKCVLQEISITKKHNLIFHITIKILYLPINLPVCRGYGQFNANWMKTTWK